MNKGRLEAFSDGVDRRIERVLMPEEAAEGGAAPKTGYRRVPRG